MKKVLIVIEDDGFPADTRARNEARSLVKQGYQVTVVAPARKGEELAARVGETRVYRYPMPFRPATGPGFILEYLYAMVALWLATLYVWARAGFDVIHLHNPPDTLILIALPFKLMGKKVVYDYNDTTAELYAARFRARGPIYRMLQFWERLSCRLSHAVLTANEACRTDVVERYGASAEKVRVVRNGPRLEDLGKLAKKTDSPADSEGPRLGYIGVLGPQDGVEGLLRIVQRLRHSGFPDLSCLIIGDGDALPPLRTRAKELGLDGAVSFTGRLPWKEAMRRLSEADVCVDPAPKNDYNARVTALKVLEYMALGKPIVAYDLPGHRESAGGAALYADPEDEADLADKVRLLLQDPDLRAHMGSEGRRRIESGLAWDYSETVLLRAYASL